MPNETTNEENFILLEWFKLKGELSNHFIRSVLGIKYPYSSVTDLILSGKTIKSSVIKIGDRVDWIYKLIS